MACAWPTTDIYLAAEIYAPAATSTQIYPVGLGANASAQSRAFAKLTDGNLYLDTGSYGFECYSKTLSGDNFLELTYASSGTAIAVYVDGNPPDTSTTALAAIGSNSPLGIGYWPVYGSFWVGDIQHVVVANITPPTSQRQRLEGWESWADGKAGSNLPTGHPYKSRAPLTTDT